ncbi:flagellar filament capping protein FliD [Vibrio sp. SM6]|uniref:Flagellar hook-associated protein 2 n=1 Tax=Vibrio agarilyticus TaxID=2726741 RepID=A0A7X8TQW7_9VIBR|nr:flagellar filament capping protein FliD [Vibrio agarilyticus]NLS13220.1 flagellar filament capping protein FliD [Vibrio agarilyticus]
MSMGPVGLSGGMDINAMVSKIVDAERLPQQQRIDNARAKVETSISAYGRLKESLDTMKTLMTNFRDQKAFAVRKVDTSDDTVVSATATTDAIAGKYAIDVLQLAQSHKVASEVLDKEAKFGPGKLQISLGDSQFNVYVDGHSKLTDVVRAVNGSTNNPGVRASIINDVDGPRMVLASNLSGEANQMKVTVDAENPQDPLKKLAYQTLEDRVKALETARSKAQAIILANAPENQSQDVADEKAISPKNTDSAPEKGEASPDQNAAPINDARAQSASNAPVSSFGAAAAEAGYQAIAERQAQAGLMPDERIGGWSDTASGTLLDSYYEPELELDEAALAKAPDVPGWTNTASGTLTDSYETAREARARFEAEQAQIERDLAAEKAMLEAQVAKEKAALQSRVESGELTPEQAKAIERQDLAPQERQRLETIDAAQAALVSAEQGFDTYAGMQEVQKGQDSIVVLDGIARLASNNNVIENAVDGIDLTIKGKTPVGKAPVEIGVEFDRPSVRSDIENFVQAYNQFYQTAKALSSFDPTTGQKGPLAGDSTVRNADSRLKAVFSSRIENAPDDLKTLTEFGITTTRTGMLEINYEMLDRQLNKNFNQLEKFFAGREGFARKIEDAIQGLTGVGGSIRTRETSLTEENYRLSDDQFTLDRRMAGLEQRTHARFSAMQDATGKMQGQLGALMNALG